MYFNPEEIRSFFKFLDPYDKYFSVCFLDAESSGPLYPYGTYYETVENILAKLHELERKKPTLHVTLNKVSDSGRRTENVTGCRVLCLDLDTPKTKEEISAICGEISPQMLVESSPGKFHLYWRVKSNITLEVWQKYQLALAFKFGGDLGLNSLAHTIRVPGVRRVTKDGKEFLPRIVDTEDLESGCPELGLDQLHELMPWMNEVCKAATKFKEDDAKERRKNFKNVEKIRKAGGKIDVGLVGRNNALFHQVLTWCFEQSKIPDLETALEYAGSINELFLPSPLAAGEVNKAVNSALSRAQTRAEEKKETAKELLETLLETASRPTNGFAGIFEYDYSTGAIADARFSTLGVVDRVFQRYGGSMLKIGEVVIAFDCEHFVWRTQKKLADIVNDFGKVATRDIFRDPEFVKHCSNANGEVSRSQVEKAKKEFLGKSFISGVLEQTLKDKRILRVESDIFDADPYRLYVGNGVLNLKTGKCVQARPEDYLLNRAKVLFDPQATCPRWEEFLLEVFDENLEPQAMVDFIQELFGYSLTGLVSEQTVFVHSGSGSNGKSKVLEALRVLLGSYSTLMVGSDLAKSKTTFNKDLERITIKIEGKRAAIVDDLDTKTQWNEGIVKNLTGPYLPTRNLYGEPRDIENHAKFHIGCNEQPEIEAQNYAIIRRICIIPYNRKFEPDAAKEASLRVMMAEEAPGILNWALEGFKRYDAQKGFNRPAELVAELEDYRTEHFTRETAVEKLLAVPTVSDGKDNWHALEDLVRYVNSKLEDTSNHVDKVTNLTLGDILKSRMKLKCERIYSDGKRSRKYWVKILETTKGTEFLEKLK